MSFESLKNYLIKVKKKMYRDWMKKTIKLSEKEIICEY